MTDFNIGDGALKAKIESAVGGPGEWDIDTNFGLFQHSNSQCQSMQYDLPKNRTSVLVGGFVPTSLCRPC